MDNQMDKPTDKRPMDRWTNQTDRWTKQTDQWTSDTQTDDDGQISNKST